MKSSLKVLTIFLSFVLILSTLSPAVFATKHTKNNAIEVNIKTIEPSTKLIIENTIFFKDKTELVSSIEQSLEDENHTYEFYKFEKNENTAPFEIFRGGFAPSELVKITHDGISQDFYLSYKDIHLDLSSNYEIKPQWVESAFDVGSFILSLNEFNQNPSFWNGFWVVADGASVVFPGVPAVSGVKRMIQESSTLKSSLEKGIKKYGQLSNVAAPPNWNGKGWHRHHIFEKRWASKLNTTEYSMLAMFVPYDIHMNISDKLAKKLPSKLTSWMYSNDDIINLHIEAYMELYAESGYDEFYEFIYKFSQTRQYK